ncbi:MAG: hypothetical protein SGJ20_22145 [Planctomycetota bacterium]|nr:hypothetical protein [Planctomycetota bacterium]
MRMKTIITFVLTLFCGVAVGDLKIDGPIELVKISLDPAGDGIDVTRVTTSLAEEKRAVSEPGKTTPRAYTAMSPVYETHRISIKEKDIVARRLDGRLIPAENFLKDLDGDTAVVLLPAGRKLDPLYAKILKPEALILELPVRLTPVPGDSPPGVKILRGTGLNSALPQP